MLNKNQSKIPSAVKDIAIVVVGVAIVWLGLRFAFGTNNPFYVVSSGSMIPTLKVNDVLVVKGGTSSFGNLKVGDIIVFNKPAGDDRVIVHRVAGIYNTTLGESIIRTKGDANLGSIPGVDFPIRVHDYIGKVAYVIPGIGLITKVISPPVNYIIIAVILAILLFNRIGGGKKDTETSSSQSSTTGTAGSMFSSPSSPSSSPISPAHSFLY
ncbi:MAG TPA: signal peptidase I [Nitrososphaeraceae archaeon]|nr:signal peptidase I [Nitrososphaeraceae archaeon]